MFLKLTTQNTACEAIPLMVAIETVETIMADVSGGSIFTLKNGTVISTDETFDDIHKFFVFEGECLNA